MWVTLGLSQPHSVGGSTHSALRSKELKVQKWRKTRSKGFIFNVNDDGRFRTRDRPKTAHTKWVTCMKIYSTTLPNSLSAWETCDWQLICPKHVDSGRVHKVAKGRKARLLCLNRIAQCTESNAATAFQSMNSRGPHLINACPLAN